MAGSGSSDMTGSACTGCDDLAVQPARELAGSHAPELGLRHPMDLGVVGGLDGCRRRPRQLAQEADAGDERLVAPDDLVEAVEVLQHADLQPQFQPEVAAHVFRERLPGGQLPAAALPLPPVERAAGHALGDQELDAAS